MNQMTYPEDCQQTVLGVPWWETTSSDKPESGRLIWAALPHIDRPPLALLPKGRRDATCHTLADCVIADFSPAVYARHTDLPIASLPNHPKEAHGIFRVKRRPAILVSNLHQPIDRNLVKGLPAYMKRSPWLVLPAYGRDQNGTRTGFPDALIQRVRRCEYSHFIWEKLPLSGCEESILRVDHIQPVSPSENIIELTQYKITEHAMVLYYEWINWHFTGQLPSPESDSLLPLIRHELMHSPQSANI